MKKYFYKVDDIYELDGLRIKEKEYIIESKHSDKFSKSIQDTVEDFLNNNPTSIEKRNYKKQIKKMIDDEIKEKEKEYEELKYEIKNYKELWEKVSKKLS